MNILNLSIQPSCEKQEHTVMFRITCVYIFLVEDDDVMEGRLVALNDVGI